jgi:hypothetical protein
MAESFFSILSKLELNHALKRAECDVMPTPNTKHVRENCGRLKQAKKRVSHGSAIRIVHVIPFAC